MRLSVVMPCFNEEGNVGRVVAQATEVGRQLCRELQVVVVDDGSTDATPTILRVLRSEIPELEVVTHAQNRGYGAAVRSGLDCAVLDYVFLTDGDGQFDLRELSHALDLLDHHDVVAGYRARRRDGWWRTLWGRSWTTLVNVFLGLDVRDANCAFKLVPRALLSATELRSEGALISAELLLEARRSELRVGQLAVSHYPRTAGRQTGASPRVIVTAFRELFRLLVRRRRARVTALNRTTT